MSGEQYMALEHVFFCLENEKTLEGGEKMKKTCACTALAALLVGSTAHGAGYRIPEQSVNAVAKAGANIASSTTADASYFNPANMSWLEDRALFEGAAEWIHLKTINYHDNRSPLYSGESDGEDFVLPTFFAVSPDYNNFRIGVALTYPGGLSKKWRNPFPRTFAEEFTLKVYELGVSGSYKINDMISVAAGVRSIYADATVRSAGQVAPGTTASRYMDGDTWEWGYNFALAVRPTQELNLSATYRSKTDLDLEGTADLATSLAGGRYHGDAGASVPLPAVLSLAGSYTFFDQLTVELEYERTFWSSYETLDFTYPVPLTNPVLNMAFDQPKVKNWDDSDTYRIGLSYDTKKSFILMAGFAYDKNPIPDSTLSFELPDSDACIYSVGVRYLANEHLEVGIGYLYDDKDDRSVTNKVINGEFTDAGAHVVAIGLSYKL
jgi:long-chain fatty acid transport protein